MIVSASAVPKGKSPILVSTEGHKEWDKNRFSRDTRMALADKKMRRNLLTII